MQDFSEGSKIRAVYGTVGQPSMAPLCLSCNKIMCWKGNFNTYNLIDFAFNRHALK